MAKDDYVDEVEEQQVDGLGTSLVILTTLILIAAFIVMQMALKGFGKGMLAG